MFTGTLLFVSMHYGRAFFLDCFLWWCMACLHVLLLAYHVCCHLWCMVSLCP
ncbi:hypothetical protein BC941DRAFT_446464 [Chlamydoabsidia padenii]|nr:hypothetical protein BC941DRAFT_446464 [Chlamydoabsidia padenii]